MIPLLILLCISFNGTMLSLMLPVAPRKRYRYFFCPIVLVVSCLFLYIFRFDLDTLVFTPEFMQHYLSHDFMSYRRSVPNTIERSYSSLYLMLNYLFMLLSSIVILPLFFKRLALWQKALHSLVLLSCFMITTSGSGPYVIPTTKIPLPVSSDGDQTYIVDLSLSRTIGIPYAYSFKLFCPSVNELPSDALAIQCDKTAFVVRFKCTDIASIRLLNVKNNSYYRVENNHFFEKEGCFNIDDWKKI